MANILVIKQNKKGYGYYEEHLFLTNIDEEGNKDYFLDGCRVSKAYGNGVYKRLVENCPDYYEVIITPVTVMNKDELIKKYESKVDPYADYIDDGRQWKIAVERNEQSYRCIKALELCIKGENL